MSIAELTESERSGPGSSALRIAVVAPPWFESPPRAYGGIGALVAGLVDGLVARGHEVTLVGAGRNGTAAQRFVAVYDQPPSSRLGEALPEVVQAAAAARVVGELEVDLVHDHTVAGPLTARSCPTPRVVTVHSSVDGEPGRYLRELGDAVELVAISDAQRRRAPHLNWAARVHNAVDVRSFPVGTGAGDYLLFLGRFSPDKGAHLAIEAARSTRLPLVLAGKLNEPAEKAYFEQAIRPHLGRGVMFVGEADGTLKRELYGGATALLFPVCWDEPFGLVMVEAMACGTPVVALNRGSVPEVVRHGVTGVVVDRPDQLPLAVETAKALDRTACRRHAERHFDLPGMVAGYDRLFQQVAREAARTSATVTTAGGSVVPAAG